MTQPSQLYRHIWHNPLDALDTENLSDLRPAIEIRVIVRPEPGEAEKVLWMLQKCVRDVVTAISNHPAESEQE